VARRRLRRVRREAAQCARVPEPDRGCTQARGHGIADVSEPATILVVDDLPQNVRLLEAVLAPRGYAIATATSGGEALERMASDPIDLVLLDIVMPKMDSYEVCRALRADASTRFLPVVMITASGEQEKVATIEAGADDFIAKPVDQAELLARVGSLPPINRYTPNHAAPAA